MDFRERSNLQLLRVMKGAHELTKMIDSCFIFPNSSKQQSLIVNELLRGSLELNQSLLILSRLQMESSKKPMTELGQPEGEEDEPGLNPRDLIRFKRKNERRHFVDGSSANCKQEMKKLISDRLDKLDDERVSLNKNSMMLPEKKKIMAPNLIARLMGLDDLPFAEQIEAKKEEKLLRRSKSHVLKPKSLCEIFESMRDEGVLKNEQPMNHVIKPDVKKHEKTLIKIVEFPPPIVIMKHQHSTHRERGESNRISEDSDLIYEDKVADTVIEAMNIEKEMVISTQNPKTAVVVTSQKEKKRTENLKKMEINEKNRVKKKGVNAIRDPLKLNSMQVRMAEKQKATAKLSSQAFKSNDLDSKDKISLKSASFNSVSSWKEEEISKGILKRKSNKTEEQKFKGEKLNSIQAKSFSSSRSNSFSLADCLLKQAQKENIKKPFMIGKTLNNGS